MLVVLRKTRVLTFVIGIAALLSALLLRNTAEELFADVYAPDEPPAVLIIDAGHGGEDGGAQSASGTLESAVNLSIALKLDAIAGLHGIRTVMTRASEDIDYPDSAKTTAARKASDQNARAVLINSYPDAVLISIHQNAFPDPRPSGSQVLYAKTEGSEQLGKLMHAQLIEMLCPQNRRVPAPVSESIFLLKSAKCTAVLVECGFLSNSAEAALLENDTYQIKLSAVLLASYLQYLEQPDGMET